MKDTIYSVAQIKTVRNDYEQNLKKHLEYIGLSARYGSKIIIFPELSITGYERELARGQCFIKDDSRLDCLQKASIERNITVVSGAPLLLDNNLYIAAWIFTPTMPRQIYIKKFLHEGEELFFQESKQYDPHITIGQAQVSFAICHDIEVDEHIECVRNKNSSVYAAGIAYSEQGIQGGLDRLQAIAKKYSIAVLMSNYSGACWEMMAGGRSSIWSKKGELVISADPSTECLIVAEVKEEEWKGKIVKL